MTHLDDGLICPHCGTFVNIKNSLTDFHYEHPYEIVKIVCPGSQQNPRYAYSDARLLWNGKPNKHFRG